MIVFSLSSLRIFEDYTDGKETIIFSCRSTMCSADLRIARISSGKDPIMIKTSDGFVSGNRKDPENGRTGRRDGSSTMVTSKMLLLMRRFPPYENKSEESLRRPATVTGSVCPNAAKISNSCRRAASLFHSRSTAMILISSSMAHSGFPAANRARA